MITGGDAVLLDRGDELRRVRMLLGHASAGRGSLLTVEGPAGPPRRVLKISKGTSCCPPGKVARPATKRRFAACCPPTGPCDTCEDVPCLPGTYCVNGTCFSLK